MFNRLTRFISLAKRQPFNVKPSFTISRVMKIPVNSPAAIAGCDTLLKNGFCSSAEKPGDRNNPTESTSGINVKDNDTEEEEVIPEELKSAIEAEPALLKRYKILQLEVDVMRHAGKLVPNEIKPLHWLQLLKEDSRTARKKYLQFLFTVEKKQENKKKKKDAARIERESNREESSNKEEEKEEGSDYRLHKITMFMRIYDTTIHHFYHSRLIQAMMFGEKLIIDCGYYAQMTPRECSECAKQLAYMFAQNRLHRDPFDLHFCNVDKSSLLMQKLHRLIPTVYEPEFPLNISEKSYLDTFDKDKLVYLTPHCNTEMTEYETDKTYIIGAIVDKTNSDPLSLARAKKDGLKMAKLPLNKYLLWGPGSGKRLPLNQMVGIITDLRVTKNWQIALKHIPSRKLERPIDDLKKDYVPTKKFDRFGGNNNSNNRPFRPYEQKIQASFSFRDRQKRTFNK